MQTGARPHWQCAVALVVLSAAALSSADAQSVQYRSPAGVTFRSEAENDAVVQARNALAANPANVDLILALGLAQSGVRQYREAIATFSDGLRRMPEHPMLLRWRGHRYLSVREFTRAIADLEKGIRADSSIYGLWYHLGVTRYALGNFAGAAEAFGRPAIAAVSRGLVEPGGVGNPADTADVSLATLHYGLGNWYLLQGESARARTKFEQAVASGGWPAFGFIVAEQELRRLP